MQSHADHSATAGYRQRLFRSGALDELPLELRHERIYILPSKQGLALAAVVLLMLVASINYRLSLGYALSFIFVGLFAACLIHTYRNLSGVRIDSVATRDCYVPEPHICSVQLAASGKRPRYSIKINAGAFQDQVDIEQTCHSTALLRIPNPQRGRHALGRLTLSSTFPLGLWRAWAYVHAPVSYWSYPAPETPQPAFPTESTSQSESASRHPTHLGGDKPSHEGDFESLRSWQPGDTPSSVAWKAVARGNGWYSKDLRQSQAAASFNFNWSDLPSALSAEEKLARLTAWVDAAEARSARYVVHMPGLPASASRVTRQTVLRHLAVFGTANGTP